MHEEVKRFSNEANVYQTEKKSIMKRKTRNLFTLIFLILTIRAHADIYIQERVHAESFYDIGTVFPAVTTERELWIGAARMTFIDQKMTVIIDNNKNLISILNRKVKTYIESPIPLDMSKIISQGLYLKIKSYQINGFVKEIKKTKRIKEKNCGLFEIIIDSPYSKEIKVWATTDVPFDWKEVRGMYSNIWRLGNYSADFIRMFGKIKGYRIISQETMWMYGCEEKREFEVIKISEKNPPENIYSIPGGYTKIDKLSLQDFRSLGIAIYFH